MTINSLPIETIKYYAQQYANTLKYHRQHQKVYQKTDVGRKNSQKRSSKYYFRKNNIYHPQYNNSPTAKEGRKYKRNKNKTLLKVISNRQSTIIYYSSHSQ